MAPGCLIGGFVMQKYGRKFAHYFLCIPTVFGWLAIMFGNNLADLLLGRFLTGKIFKKYKMFFFCFFFHLGVLLYIFSGSTLINNSS
jgi:hypothetical protein